MRIAALAAVFLALAGCGGEEPGPEARDARAVIATDDGRVTVEVEVADTADERARGLMGRDSLPADAGMAFVYDDVTTGGYWMKDTLIPLSIAFYRDGRIVRILDMEPCRAEPCPVYDPGVEYDGALEVNQGAFARLGVEEGDEITIERSG